MKKEDIEIEKTKSWLMEWSFGMELSFEMELLTK